MQFTKCRRYLIKELSSEDHLEILKFSEAYVEYMSKNQESLLIRFYYHFYREKDGKVILILFPFASFKPQFSPFFLHWLSFAKNCL